MNARGAEPENPVSEVVRGEISRRFAPTDVPGATEALGAVVLQGWAVKERDRVQLAAIKLSGGSMSRLIEEIAVAQADWRDVLVAAGLENSDWREVLRRNGMTVR